MPADPVVRDLAAQRIDQLMRLAFETAPSDLALANRYVEMAIKLSTRHRVRLGPKWNRYVCRKCGSLLLPGRTSRVRFRQERSSHLVVTCLKCGAIRRYGFAKSRN